MESKTSLEGQLLAHRRLLARIVIAFCGRDDGAALRDFLEERQVLRDGQEDPGAVPVEALSVEFAVAEEFRALSDAVKAFPSEARTSASPAEGLPKADEATKDLPSEEAGRS